MRKTTAWLRAAAALLLVLWAACGDGERGSSSLAALGVDDGASRGASKSAEVSVDKGASIALKTGATLDVPAGAVDKSVKLTMERPADTKAIELVERFKKDQDRIVSAPYVLTPHGTKFKEDVSVTLPVSKSDAGETWVAWLEDENDTEWKLLGVATSDGKKAEVKIKHFSVLVLVEDASDLPVMDDEPGTPDAEVGDDDAGRAVMDAGSRNDAAAIDPSADAADTDPGADAGSLDAGVAPTKDASTGEERDAAPALPDAGVVVDPDAGDDEPDVDPVAPDAGVVADAGDDGGGPGDGGQDAGVDAAALALQSMYLKLVECSAVVQAGTFSHQLHNDPILTCVYGCMAQGDCNDAVGTVCNLPTDGGSPGAQTCVDNCYTFICPDSQPAMRCNETQECTNGEDEQGCFGEFTCNAMTFPDSLRCNAVIDCPDQSDETGCFTCDGGSNVLQPEQQCDGVVNCYDGTDEPATCAAISCPAPA